MGKLKVNDPGKSNYLPFPSANMLLLESKAINYVYNFTILVTQKETCIKQVQYSYIYHRKSQEEDVTAGP